MSIKAMTEQAKQINSLYRTGTVGSLKAFHQCGKLLNHVKAKMKHGEWLPWVKENLEFSIDAANRLMRFVNSEPALNFDSLNPAEAMELSRGLWGHNNIDVHYSSASNEWHTPSQIIDCVLKVLGRIDLDPCSNDGEPNIPAKRVFTINQDGLSMGWNGKVYMNPPYGRVIGDWAQKLVSEYTVGNTTEAIALVPARVDTDWFRLFRDFIVCFIDGRLRFSGIDNSAPFPSAAVYLGGNVKRFTEAFSKLGDTWIRWQG